MSLLFNVLYAHKAKGTHHKLALDALRLFRIERAEAWQNLFLRHIEPFLAGAKAPDDQFKDFKNHVLHVGDGYWGGACGKAEEWYDRTVELLRQKHWEGAVFAAGVLSHYYSDPIQPFHTGQSEAEGAIHRACEWSISQSYDDLRRILEQDLGGYPEVTVPDGEDWLAEMVRAGARASHPDYGTLIEHYNLAAGVKNPPAGLDQEMKDCLALLLGHASAGFARILERAIEEAAVEPPAVAINLLGVLAALTVPLFWVTKKMHNARERAVVEAMYKELQATGRVDRTLPEDDRTVRELHAAEVLRVPVAQLSQGPLPATGAQHGQGAASRAPAGRSTVGKKAATPKPEQTKVEDQPEVETAVAPQGADAPRARLDQAHGPRFYLQSNQPVEDAPSVGPKTAARLAQVGVRTVADLLRLDVEAAAKKLADRRLSADVLRDWQAQAELCCRTPGLRGHDAQLLVECGVREAESLARASEATLFEQVEAVANSALGERILRSGKRPDLAEVRHWIASARQARPLEAA